MGWKNVDAIIGNKLLLGNLIAARATRTLSERGVTHIVSVCTDPIPADVPAGGIKQLRLQIPDVEYVDLLIHLPAACRFIHQALAEGGVVLVHSDQGKSRAAAVVAAYMMATQHVSATDAQDALRRVREQVWIRPGFHEQLVLWEICQYNVTPDNGVYKKWRMEIDNSLRRS